jgi:type IV secretory pathway TrbD component
LQEIGFQIDRSHTRPDFPLNSLTALALGIFAYLVVVTIWFFSSHKPDPAAYPSALQQGLLLASKITLARVTAIGLTVWLLQKFAFFRRKAGDQPRYFAYLVNGILAGVLAAGVFVLFSQIAGDVLLTEEVTRGAERIGILSGILCAAVAFCCNLWNKEGFPPAWYRATEAIGCGFAMVAGTALLWFWGMAPKVDNADIALATWIVFPSALAMMIGACVPHIYRVSLARSAAAARRTSAIPQNARPPQEPLRLVPSVSEAAADPTAQTEATAESAFAMSQHFDNAA